MEQVEIGADKGLVTIEQEYDHGEVSVIHLHPNQVDAICEWLQKAKAEALVQGEQAES
jgi:hypothetical protein